MASLSSPLLLFCAGLCLVYMLMKAIQLYRKRQEQLKTLESFPGPPSHWLFGNIFQLTSHREIPRILLDWSQKFPYAYPLWFGGFVPLLMITHPKYAKTLFDRKDPKDLTTYKFMIPWIGNGIIVINGPKWQKHRRFLLPIFQTDMLKLSMALIADATKVMLDKWEKLIAKDPTESLEIFEHISVLTLDILMKFGFSCKTSIQVGGELDYYVKCVSDLTFLVFERINSAILRNDFLYSFTSSGRRFKEACRLVHQFTEKVIEERKKSLQNERELKKIQKERNVDILDILLCAKDENGIGLSDEEIHDEVTSLLFGGQDTSATGIAWTLYSLAQHPEHQERCREEIKEILGDHEDFQWGDLGRLTYTTMCIKESLRLYPPVPTESRQLGKPITFSDGRTLPEGFLVAVSIQTLHRNPSVWQDPEVFDPSRFSIENSSQRHSHAFIPFSAGSRNCIGQQFAMIEMKIAIALTLLHFELLPDPANIPVPVPQIVLTSENGIRLFLKKLN